MADAEGMIIEDVKYSIAPGLTVYDHESKNVGTVHEIHRETGYFKVMIRPLPQERDNPFAEKFLYVPFSLVTNIDPRELFVSASRDQLRRDYANPPARTTRVEMEFGHEIAVTTEQSGYDGTSIVVRRVSMDEVRKAIRVGDRVFSSDLTELGKVKQYDAVRGWMSITRDDLSKEPTLQVPVTIVDCVERNKQEVHLVTSQADLERMEHLEPA